METLEWLMQSSEVKRHKVKENLIPKKKKKKTSQEFQIEFQHYVKIVGGIFSQTWGYDRVDLIQNTGNMVY